MSEDLVKRLEVRKWAERIHVALADPSRPRQSVGEMAQAFIVWLDEQTPMEKES